MPCAQTHRLVNAVTTFSYLAFREPQPGERPLPHPVVGAAGTALLASLPDLLEPAIHPDHRQFFHSLLFSIGVGLMVYEAYRWETETPMQGFMRHLIMIGGSAYLLHLAADAFTAKSIPFVGKF